MTSANYTTSYVPGTLTVTTAVQLTPASLTFASQNVGTTSPVQTATLEEHRWLHDDVRRRYHC